MRATIRVAATIVAAALACGNANAATHIWMPTAAPSAATTSADSSSSPMSGTQTVVVTGSTIYWGIGRWDVPLNEAPSPVNFNNLSLAIASARERAVAAANVCSNPLISPSFKTVKSTSSMVDRWLAAQALFNSIQQQRLWSTYQGAYGGISLIIDSKSYPGFKVTYADGGTETWVVNPGHATSSLKLFDTAAPDSLLIRHLNNGLRRHSGRDHAGSSA